MYRFFLLKNDHSKQKQFFRDPGKFHTTEDERKISQEVQRQAVAEARAASLREFRNTNNQLHETIGAQKVKISMLENQVADLQDRCEHQAEQIQYLQTKIANLTTE